MRITLDAAKCQGHGRCYALAGDLFDSDDEGYAQLLLDDPAGTLPPEQEQVAILAAENCPEYAIEVHPS